jgi:hypothetical protein
MMGGRCAACGRRVKRATTVGVYVPQDAGQPNAIYLLCPACQVRAEAHDDTIYRAVEMRIKSNAGWTPA